MKLAEALMQRADIQRRMNQVHRRAVGMARVQEGDTPEEDPNTLIAEYTQLNEQLSKLVMLINRVNSTTTFEGQLTIADAIALRDSALREQQFFNELADDAAHRIDRYSRSEIKFVAAISVPEARKRADAAAQRYRELDTRLQEKNWTTEFPDFE